LSEDFFSLFFGFFFCILPVVFFLAVLGSLLILHACSLIPLHGCRVSFSSRCGFSVSANPLSILSFLSSAFFLQLALIVLFFDLSLSAVV